MDNKNKAIIFFAAAVSILLIYLGVSIDISEHTEERYTEALAAETKDPCATPEGYTDESWREHMGHHPGQYKECL